MQSTMEILDVLNVLAYNMSCISTHWLIIYDSYVHQNAQNLFGEIFIKVDEKSFLKTTTYKFSHLIPLSLLSFGDFSILVLSYAYDLLNFEQIVYGIFLAVTNNRQFFWLLHLNVVAIQLQNIKCKLKTMKKQNKELKWVQVYLNSTYEMCNNINNIFGLSQLAMTFLSIQSTITMLNSAIRTTQKRYEFLNYGSFNFEYFRLENCG